MNFTQFAKKHSLQIKSVAKGNHVVDGNTPFKWKVTLINKNKLELKILFKKGAAYVYRWKDKDGNYNKVDYHELDKLVKQVRFGEITFNLLKPIPPQIDEVLECVHLDVISIENNHTWWDFAHELGLNTDSISDKKTYKTCQKYHYKLRQFLGWEAFKEFLECTPNE